MSNATDLDAAGLARKFAKVRDQSAPDAEPTIDLFLNRAEMQEVFSVLHRVVNCGADAEREAATAMLDRLYGQLFEAAKTTPGEAAGPIEGDAAAPRAALAKALRAMLALTEALRAMDAQPAETISRDTLAELEACTLVDLAMLGAELAEADVVPGVPMTEAAIAAFFLAMGETTSHVVRYEHDGDDCIIHVTSHEVLDWSKDEATPVSAPVSQVARVPTGPIVRLLEEVARAADAAAETIAAEAEEAGGESPALPRSVVVEHLDECLDAFGNLRGIMAEEPPRGALPTEESDVEQRH